MTCRRFLFGMALLVGGWTGGLCAANDASREDVTLPAKEKFHLYLLIGQSNMAGRGQVKPEDKVADPRVLMLDKNNKWVPAVDPLHSDKPTAGVGLGRGFAREMLKANPDVTIGLVPSAVGGTRLVRWQKGGDLYAQAVVRAKAAMADGTLRAILWHQGEGDSIALETAETYAERLTRMIQDLRAELGAPEVPFVAGTLGDFIIEDADRFVGGKMVNEALLQVGQSSAPAACAVSAGLKHMGDQVHFGREAILELGRRYAQALVELEKK